MKTYLVFLQNLKTTEEFVAPVTAENHDQALLVIGDKYPPRFYTLQTFYTLTDMERIVADVKRWPGVVSDVQPLVEQLTKRVTTSEPLPSLPGRRTSPLVPVNVETLETSPATSEQSEVHQEEPVISVVAPTLSAPTMAQTKRTVTASIISRPAEQSSASGLDVLKPLHG